MRALIKQMGSIGRTKAMTRLLIRFECELRQLYGILGILFCMDRTRGLHPWEAWHSEGCYPRHHCSIGYYFHFDSVFP